MTNFALLIHGPFSEYAVASMASQRKLFDKVVISGYKDDEEKWAPYASESELILSEDVFNPGPWNVNRQLNLILAGLDSIEEESVVLKLRSDQRVNFQRVTNYLKQNLEAFHGSTKFLTTNCFTRVDRLYHPSDMFIAGSKGSLAELFDIPQSHFSQLDAEILIRRLVERGEDPNLAYLWPESYIFTEFLKKVGWPLLGTFDDSERAISNYFVVLNSFAIRLRWEKKHFHYVFPFTAKAFAPFFGGPLEHPRCAKASNPQNRFYEFTFWKIAKVDTFFWIKTSPKKLTKEILINARNKLVRLLLLITPPILVSVFLKSQLYRLYKVFEYKIARRY